jgi:hypothetical protein
MHHQVPPHPCKQLGRQVRTFVAASVSCALCTMVHSDHVMTQGCLHVGKQSCKSWSPGYARAEAHLQQVVVACDRCLLLRRYGGVAAIGDCARLPAELQAGCRFRFEFVVSAGKTIAHVLAHTFAAYVRLPWACSLRSAWNPTQLVTCHALSHVPHTPTLMRRATIQVHAGVQCSAPPC